MVGPRFEQTAQQFQPRPLAAIELIAEEPVIMVKGRVAACDGGELVAFVLGWTSRVRGRALTVFSDMCSQEEVRSATRRSSSTSTSQDRGVASTGQQNHIQRTWRVGRGADGCVISRVLLCSLRSGLRYEKEDHHHGHH